MRRHLSLLLATLFALFAWSEFATAETRRIGTATELVEFAEYVNNGHGDCNAELIADIDMSGITGFPGIGNDASNLNRFHATFDGKGHRIKNLIMTGKDIALFPVCSDKTVIKNLIIDSSCSFIGTGRCAAFVSASNFPEWGDGKLQFLNCGNEAEVSGTEANCAAFLGCNYNDGIAIIIKNCYNAGHIHGSKESAALSGWINTNAGNRIDHCYNIAEVEGLDGGPTNNLFRGSVGTWTAPNNDCYDTHYAYNTGSVYDNAKVESGEMCYLLNGDQSNIQWYQTLGKDSHPIPFAQAGVVYAAANCDGTPKPGTYSNSMGTRDSHTFDANEICTLCLNGREPSCVNGIYQIATFSNLVWFANHVNEGHTTSNAALIADVTRGTIVYKPIGTVAYPYEGTFEGGRHYVDFGTWNNETYSDQGVFGVLSGNAVIKNLTAKGSITAGNFAGGIAGSVRGVSNVQILNCGNQADIHVNGVNAGGILGVVYGSEAKVTIKDCYNRGSVTGNESGGITGWASDSRSSIINCYNVGGTFCRRNGCVITNCYNVTTASEGAAACSTANVTSGTLLSNLNNSRDPLVWSQSPAGYPVPYRAITVWWTGEQIAANTKFYYCNGWSGKFISNSSTTMVVPNATRTDVGRFSISVDTKDTKTQIKNEDKDGYLSWSGAEAININKTNNIRPIKYTPGDNIDGQPTYRFYHEWSYAGDLVGSFYLAGNESGTLEKSKWTNALFDDNNTSMRYCFKMISEAQYSAVYPQTMLREQLDRDVTASEWAVGKTQNFGKVMNNNTWCVESWSPTPFETGSQLSITIGNLEPGRYTLRMAAGAEGTGDYVNGSLDYTSLVANNAKLPIPTRAGATAVEYELNNIHVKSDGVLTISVCVDKQAARWIFARINKLVKESPKYETMPDGYTDYTSWINNPDFTEDNGGGWSNNFGGVSWSCAEQWNRTCNDKQVINNLPNGYYTIKVQGFYRNSDNLQKAMVFGNGAYAPIGLISGTENNMEQAHNSFNDNKYLDNSVLAYVHNGRLELGVTRKTKTDGDWLIFDYFRLYKMPSTFDPGDDFTRNIYNPSFEACSRLGGGSDYANNIDGWTIPTLNGWADAAAYLATDGGHTVSPANGNNILNLWSSEASNYAVVQTISGLPSGKYTLTARYASDNNTATLSMGTNSVDFTSTANNNTIANLITLEDIQYYEGTTMEIKLSSDKWFKCDDFRLTLVTSEANDIVSSDGFYLYNIDGGAFLGSGNSWGTQASIGAAASYAGTDYMTPNDGFRTAPTDLAFKMEDLTYSGKYKIYPIGQNYGIYIIDNGADAYVDGGIKVIDAWTADGKPLYRLNAGGNTADADDPDIEMTHPPMEFIFTEVPGQSVEILAGKSRKVYTISIDPANANFGVAKLGETMFGWSGELYDTSISPLIPAERTEPFGARWILINKDEYLAIKEQAEIARPYRMNLWPYIRSAKRSADFLTPEHRVALEAQLDNLEGIWIDPTTPVDQLVTYGAMVTAGVNQVLDNASLAEPCDATFLLDTKGTTGDGSKVDFGNWTRDGFNIVTARHSDNDKYFGHFWFEKWNAGPLPNSDFYQELNDMPNGTYTIQADVHVRKYGDYHQDAKGVFLYGTGNEHQRVVCNTPGENPTVGTDRIITFETPRLPVKDHKLRFGIKFENTDADWVAFDNFRIRYHGPAWYDYDQSDGFKDVFGVNKGNDILTLGGKWTDEASVQDAYVTEVMTDSITSVCLVADQVNNQITVPAETSWANIIVYANDVYNVTNTYNVVDDGDATCADLRITDKKAFGGPTDFEAKKLTYTRNNTLNLNTVCMPFAFDASEIEELFGANAEVYVYQGLYKDERDFTRIALVQKTTGTIPAGTPCLVNSTVSSWNIVKTGDRDVAMVPAIPTVTKVISGITSNMVGSFYKRALGTGYFKLNSDGSYFVKSTASSTVTPFRMYLTFDMSAGVAPEKMAFSFFEEEEEEILVDAMDKVTILQEGDMYDMSGRRVMNPRQRGIYIVNGKKVIK